MIIKKRKNALTRSELPIFILSALISSFVMSCIFFLPFYIFFNIPIGAPVIFYIYIFLRYTIPPIINMIVEERLKAYFKLMTLDGELELQFVKK